MISVWWLLIAFIGGGWAGMLLIALMRMPADLPEQSISLPRLDRPPRKADPLLMVDGFRHIQNPRFYWGPQNNPFGKVAATLNQETTAG
ncbi:MAG TPA: hypothetical protein VMQ50_04305 [Casimicrobiaceae bacterium]|nr:hypothetical protein [Casimicrobiaceae bacterium]